MRMNDTTHPRIWKTNLESIQVLDDGSQMSKSGLTLLKKPINSELNLELKTNIYRMVQFERKSLNCEKTDLSIFEIGKV